MRDANTEEYYGLLDGVKLSVKDLFDVKGYKTGAGLPKWLDSAPVATEHAKAISLLLEDGAYLISKTQLDELAYSLAGINSHYGVSRNPFDSTRVSGGSSSGAAVSVATGKSDIGLATDTGGSIRVPASYCGLYGLRPTYGRVPIEGLVPLAPRFDTAGLLTRDIKLMETAFNALFADEENEKEHVEIDTLLWCEALWEGVDQNAKRYAKDLFEKYPGNKGTISSPVLDAEQRRKCFSILQAQSIWDTHGKWLKGSITEFGQDIQIRLEWGRQLTESDIASAETLLQKWQSDEENWLPKGSVLLIPTVPSVAPKINVKDDEQVEQRNTLLGLTSIAGLSGWPQLQCPAITVDGLPVGISFLGRENSDIQIIKFAQEVLRDV
ncbi:amidase family protein [Vibrio hannami]|uniref:amidase family protein n=1 Tax=Vibrio hannami TaxID=2717094 RepID=UPI00240FC0F5|nr:amidase family protein [Vibrio hannami]MDG3085255.1 amidase family protein [Vibrio hannami]